MTNGTGLKDFQRDTVAYVLDRFYGTDATDRFLVADEVGMGKTLVARGVIEGVIERCSRDPKTKRVDVLYICSNAEIARQNLVKLTVKGAGSKPFNTRITLLAVGLADLNREPAQGEKAINFISFTPGTSFDRGRRGGKVEERALLYVMLTPLFRGPKRRAALERILRLGVAESTWNGAKNGIGNHTLLRRSEIAGAFRAALKGTDVRRRLRRAVNGVTGRPGRLSGDDRREFRQLVSDLRDVLGRASVEHLSPDLVILDEFQRFKHLLETPDEDEEEVSSLASELFTYKGAKILLLSATPYRGFTFGEERTLSGDVHHEDFLQTLEFLFDSEAEADRVRALLAEFRDELVRGADPSSALSAVRHELLRVMCRTERPSLEVYDMLEELDGGVPAPSSADLQGFVALDRMARELEAQLSIEYWKSVPYFLNFMDGYQLGSRVRERPDVAQQESALAQTLKASVVRRRQAIDLGNARLRALSASTVQREWWRLLWLPPSLPYTEPGAVYASFADQSVRKRLIFSSWAAAPSAIASLLSYEAERRMMPTKRASRTRRLDYGRAPDGRAGSMTTFSLFCPLPDLAAVCDVRAAAVRAPHETRAIGEVEETCAETLGGLPIAGAPSSSLSADTWYWAVPLIKGLGRWHERLDELTALIGVDADAADDETRSQAPARRQRNLQLHVERALGVVGGNELLGAQPEDLNDWVVRIGLFSPANIAWRAVKITTSHIAQISDEARFDAATIIAEGFRSLFNRPEVMSLLDVEYPSGEGAENTYWQSILRYCADGNLQAVMDEYLHHKVEDENLARSSEDNASDRRLCEMAKRIQQAIALRISTLEAFDPMAPEGAGKISFNTRFAVRYGSARGQAKTDDRAVERLVGVKEAFNSPFWPFVLASTSVGQEGIDLHWWCHSVVHWNLPANPVDFEQREGRVHRYKGHAIRKNVAAKHRQAALGDINVDPWTAAFAAAEEDRPHDPNGPGELWPSWVYPGDSKIERWIPAFRLSRDEPRIEEMRVLRALYRVCFGQPHQEDLIELLRKSGGTAESAAKLQFDLRPPKVATGVLRSAGA